MDRRVSHSNVIAKNGLRQMYGRVLAMWASDRLTAKTPMVWPCDRDPQGDFRDHDWRCLYLGSVLDD